MECLLFRLGTAPEFFKSSQIIALQVKQQQEVFLEGFFFICCKWRWMKPSDWWDAIQVHFGEGKK